MLKVPILKAGDMGSTAYLFAPIQAPKIKRIFRRAVQNVLADRAAYEAGIEKQARLVAVLYRACFTETFLKLLIRALIFGAQIKLVSEFTGKLFKTKLLEMLVP